MKELIKQKQEKIDTLFNQFTNISSKKIQLLEKDAYLINDDYDIQEKIKKYQRKLDNINNFERNKNIIKIFTLIYHIILASSMTIILSLNFSNLSFLSILATFIISNIISGSVMYSTNKIIINFLKKKINLNYSTKDLEKTIRSLKGEHKELKHQRVIIKMTISKLQKQINDILNNMNLEKYEVRKLKNQVNYSLYPKENDEKPKTKQITK